MNDWSVLAWIDVHVHAEHSCRQLPDPIQAAFEETATIYFHADAKRPSIVETMAYYRERNIGFVAFASIDPHKGKAGVIEARRLIADYGAKEFKFHSADAGFRSARPNGMVPVRGDRRARAAGDISHPPFGNGQRMTGGGGIRLKWGQPMLVDDVAVDFPI